MIEQPAHRTVGSKSPCNFAIRDPCVFIHVQCVRSPATLASQFVQEEQLDDRYDCIATSSDAQSVLAEAPVQL